MHKFEVAGYTVRGVDMRDNNSSFEDFIAVRTDAYYDDEQFIKQEYSKLGFEVKEIIFEDTFTSEIDLLAVYKQKYIEKHKKSL